MMALVAASGGAYAAERSLMGIVLGRSYRQVLTKFGSPTRVQPVVIPVPGQGGQVDPNAAGAPGGYGVPGGPGGPGYGGPPSYGAPGGADTSSPGVYPGGASTGGGYPGGPGYGGPPSYGAPAGGPPGYGGLPGGYGGPGGGSTGGGPPVLPPVGGGYPGAPGAPGYGDPGSTSGIQITGVGNGIEWIYNRPNGVTLAFIINEDGRVAQISVSGRSFASARTAKGVSLGAPYNRVLALYGFPQQHLVGGYFVEAYYTKNHHASFTFVNGKLVRITIALAD
jgi:hypothetical protein